MQQGLDNSTGGNDYNSGENAQDGEAEWIDDDELDEGKESFRYALRNYLSLLCVVQLYNLY